jgi:hypothetical protein
MMTSLHLKDLKNVLTKALQYKGFSCPLQQDSPGCWKKDLELGTNNQGVNKIF